MVKIPAFAAFIFALIAATSALASLSPRTVCIPEQGIRLVHRIQSGPTLSKATVQRGTMELQGRGFGTDTRRVFVFVIGQRLPASDIVSLRDNAIRVRGAFRAGEAVQVGIGGSVSRPIVSVAEAATPTRPARPSATTRRPSSADLTSMNEHDLEIHVRKLKVEGKSPLDAAHILHQGHVAGGKAFEVLVKVYERPIEFGVKLMGAVGYGLRTFASNLSRHVKTGTAEAIFRALKQAGFKTEEITFTAQGIFLLTAQFVALTWQRVGEKLDAYISPLVRAYKLTGDQAAAILKRAGYKTSDVVRSLFIAFGRAGDKVASWMVKAGFKLNDVSEGLTDAFSGQAERAAAALIRARIASLSDIFRLKAFAGKVAGIVIAARQANVRAVDVVNAMIDAIGVKALVAAKHLRDAGYDAIETASALQKEYHANMMSVVLYMRSAPYTILQIAGAAKQVYNVKGDDLAVALRTAGFNANQITIGLKREFNANATTTARWLRKTGLPAEQVAQALRAEYRASAGQAAKALVDAGYLLNEVTNALVKAFSITLNQAQQAMTSVGLRL